MPSVEPLYLQLHRLIETVRVEAPAIGVRPRLIEALHAAIPAEQMLRRARAEPIARQLILTRKQSGGWKIFGYDLTRSAHTVGESS